MPKGNFLMVYYNTPKFIKNIQEKIPKEEIYIGTDDERKGIEKETHVTLLACVPESVKCNDIKKELKELKEYLCIPHNISMFDNEEYDVLKSDVFSNELVKTNSMLIDKFGSNSEFKDYKPHMTIAYLKKGFGKKYCTNMIDKIEILTPTKFVFSEGENDKKTEWK